MKEVYIAFGSNLGNREENINKAIEYLKKNSLIKIEKISSIIETEPQGGPEQPKYLNGIIKIKTELLPRELLEFLQEIEHKLKRKRLIKNGPRTIDLDIILYEDEFIDEPDLKIPHPRMFERDFVINPLIEIEPEFRERLKFIKERYDCCKKHR